MRERVYRSEAIILRRNDFSESDRLLVLATPEGKRRVVAKGIRKTTSRFGARLEPNDYWPTSRRRRWAR